MVALPPPCAVLAVPPAPPAAAVAHFEASFAFETDCWDVHASLTRPDPGFVVLDVRSPESFSAGHLPGARSLPHGRISARALAG